MNVEYSDVHVGREQSDYVSLSFSTISSVGANASIIHYRLTTGSPSLTVTRYAVRQQIHRWQ